MRSSDSIGIEILELERLRKEIKINEVKSLCRTKDNYNVKRIEDGEVSKLQKLNQEDIINRDALSLPIP